MFEARLEHGRDLLARDPAGALAHAEALIDERPDPRVCRLAAEACRRLGRVDDAVSAELAGIQAALPDPAFKQAAIAEAEGRPAESLTIAEEYLGRQPDDLLALTIAAEAAISLWRLEHAEEMLRTVLGRAPTFLRASMLLATCLAKQVRVREAVSVLEEVVGRKPKNAPALTYLSQLRAEVRDNEEAVRLHEKLVSLEPGRAERLINLAQHYRIIGRRDEALNAFRKALDIDPDNGSAWWSLANYFPATLDAGDERSIREALARRAGKLDEAALHLALGLLADRAGDHARAFDYFIAGKKLRLANQPYDPEPITIAVDGVIDTFTPEFYAARSASGWSDDSPIFILGMPRSGTTLVERILGRHTAIEAAGELQIMQRLAEGSRRDADDPEHYAGLLESLSDSGLARVGKQYVEASRDYRRTDKPRFVDKNNLNWMHIGLILLTLPDARIIDVRRDALDCCWANFKMLFAESFSTTNDLRHVGRFYADYVRLLDAMKVAAPDRILSVRYEDVVDYLEGSTRRMLDFLGLPFEAACLDFHLSTDAVATASSEQVRAPINRKGIGSAEPYRRWLGPMIEELGGEA
jgi:tetratricopeptide (TPR) repeat protein